MLAPVVDPLENVWDQEMPGVITHVLGVRDV